jgi:hypothetical protein
VIGAGRDESAPPQAGVGRSDRRTLLLLARVPLLSTDELATLDGRSGPAGVYRSIAGLRVAGLVGGVTPPLDSGRSVERHFLTERGIAAIARDQAVDPLVLARRFGLGRTELATRLRALPEYAGLIRLLIFVASTPGADRTAELVAWESPWRRILLRPTAKRPVPIELPGAATLALADGSQSSYLLLPDFGHLALRAFAPTIGRLYDLRAMLDVRLPTLALTTTDAGRLASWRELIEASRAFRGEAFLAVRLATWAEVGTAVGRMARRAAVKPNSVGAGGRLVGIGGLVGAVGTRPVSTRRAAQAPRLDDGRDEFAPRTWSPAERGPGESWWLELTPKEWQLLEIVGTHPFLSASDLTVVLGWGAEPTHGRIGRLLRGDLVRRLDVAEIGPSLARQGFLELTVSGIAAVAGRWGVTRAIAVRYGGLVGGGPAEPIGPRRSLVRYLAHTVGANAVFVALFAAARRIATAGIDAEVAEWIEPALAARGKMRPDGYGVLRYRNISTSFFLEYERGTLDGSDYADKLDAYYRSRDDSAPARAGGFPLLLVVCANSLTEERFARGARAAAIGQASPLGVLLTAEWRYLADPLNPEGPLGPIWRRPDGGLGSRVRFWRPGG